MAAGDDWLQQQLSELNINFDEADANKSGSLSMAELKEVMEKSGFTGTQRDFNKIFFEADADNNFTISKEEFGKAVGKIPTGSRREMALMRAFKAIDKDNSGAITKSELNVSSYMKNTGLTEKQIDDLYKFIFKEDDERIQYDEFLRVMNFQLSESTLNQLFTKLDKDGSGELTVAEMREAINADGDLSRVWPQLNKLLDDMENDFLGRKMDFHRFVSLWMKKKDQLRASDFAENPFL